MSLANPSLAAARLRALTPIDELTQSSFKDLLHQTVFRSVNAGAQLYQLGDRDDWTYYLLEGSVETVNAAHSRLTIKSGTQQSQEPLGGNRKPRQESARAISPCTIARIPTSLLEILLEPQAATGEYEVSDFAANADALENVLQVRIYEDYANDALEIPSLPDVALRIRQAVEDPDVTAREVDRIVAADPACAARLIQVANSPAHAGTVKVESTRDAVTRLGLVTTRELVTSLLLKQLFTADSELLNRQMVELWNHSTRVAAICYHLAKARNGFSPDRALLAGLVHDIGALPVLGAAQHHQELIQGESALADTVSQLRAQVGAMVLRQWNFPEDLVTVALEAEEWERSGNGKADYCDLVLVAQMFSFIGTPEFVRRPNLSSLPAFQRVTSGDLDPKATMALLDAAQADITELQRLIGGG